MAVEGGRSEGWTPNPVPGVDIGAMTQQPLHHAQRWAVCPPVINVAAMPDKATALAIDLLLYFLFIVQIAITHPFFVYRASRGILVIPHCFSLSCTVLYRRYQLKRCYVKKVTFQERQKTDFYQNCSLDFDHSLTSILFFRALSIFLIANM